jgi:hydrogenase nickel incorporation protein HypA/HybF
MHEMGIASSVLEAVRGEMRRYPGARPARVSLRIGEMAAIDQESLRFCFEALSSGTDLEGLQLEIEQCPRRHRCKDCGNEFNVADYDFQCRMCGALNSECISGDELELAYMEIEDHEPSTVGAKSPQ